MLNISKCDLQESKFLENRALINVSLIACSRNRVNNQNRAIYDILYNSTAKESNLIVMQKPLFVMKDCYTNLPVTNFHPENKEP